MTAIKRELLPLLFLAFLLLFSLRAYAQPYLFESHDAGTHTARLANYYLALKEGQFPPTLAPHLQGSLGYPIFIFIYPLPYLTGALFHYIGLSYAASLKLVMATGHFLSGIFFYLFLKHETKQSLPSLVGTLLFTFAPYRFVLLFVRGALAESFSYLFVASTLFCLNRLIHHQSSFWLGLTSLSLSGLLLSHQLTSIIFLPLLIIYTITQLILSDSRRSILIKTSFAFILAFGIAAYIYLPNFFERQYLQFDQLLAYTQDHFVTFGQLISSPWGYGFSKPGTYRDEMSFQIGSAQLFSVLFALIFLSCKYRHQRHQPVIQPQLVTLTIWIALFIFTFILMVDNPINHWLWLHLPGLTYIDFPWRLLGLSITSAAIISALFIAQRRNSFLAALLITTAIVTNLNHLHIQGSVELDDVFFENYYGSATSRNEFLTIWRQSAAYGGIFGDYQASNPNTNIEPIISSTTHIEILSDSDQPTDITFNRFYFPGWQVWIDDQQISFNSGLSITTDAQLDIGLDHSGFFRASIPAGHHHTKAIFQPSPIRYVGLITSCIGLLISLSLTFFPSSFLLKHQHFFRHIFKSR